ncbi:MAG: dephospho-CoA kinase, partial [Herpetosiphonaceae bacterium]|nr:dephospho-CoA kinase [Herpetosiphonaceae bacterium]
ATLGRIVFSDPAKLQQLEAIVHPATRAAIHSWLAGLDQAADRGTEAKVAAVDAIKLIESDWPRFCDAVWVVRCDLAQQLERLIKRRDMARADAEQRIAAQSPQQAKIAVADVVIDNSGTLAATRQQVQTAWAAMKSGKQTLPPHG